MSDDRWRDDEANANDPRAPYVDRRPLPGRVRPASKQLDHRGPPTPEEIAAFIAQQFPETRKEKKRLERPPGWDELDQAAAELMLGASVTTDAAAGSRMVAEVHEQMLRGDAREGTEEE